MENIFDIFGSHDPVKTIQDNSLPHKAAVKGLLSSKENIKNGSNIVKGKKVLGDVGNKMKGLDKKKLENFSEHFKKPTQGSTSASKFSHETVPSEIIFSEKNPIQEDIKTSLNFLWENDYDSKDIDKLPPVETQGPSFWADDDYESRWPESPVDDDFLNAAKIWNIETKCTERSLRSPSPLTVDINDNFDFCLDTPKLYTTDLVLEEVSVQFPWEI